VYGGSSAWVLAQEAPVLEYPSVEEVQRVVADEQLRNETLRDKNKFVVYGAVLLGWLEPVDPFHIAGPIHYVGTRGLCMYLLTSSEGHILIHSGMPGSDELVLDSVRTLGFDPSDIRILLTGHAHIDHAGGHAAIAEATGAEVWSLDSEIDLLESGGRNDFFYFDTQNAFYEPAEVDHVLRDGDVIQLGDIALNVRHTPGHTRGSTTFWMDVVEAGRTYRVVFPSGGGANPGYRVHIEPSYPGIADDFRYTYYVLGTLHADILLPLHAEVADVMGRAKRARESGIEAWVDPDGYRNFIRADLEELEALIDTEVAAGTAP
jgi:metallo-beta-lactamase class B